MIGRKRKKRVNILHTSDWHLGQSFKNRSREAEHQGFLSWLLQVIEKQDIDVLIVAGDIFDTSNPPNYALKMYHNFLADIIKTHCKDIIIVAGNHDSISTLEVSKDLLKSLNVHVVASGENQEEGIVQILKDDKLKAIVCAVPYLRDRVLRNANESKSSIEVENELREGMKTYYKSIYKKAKEISGEVPVIATGHFTTTGASISPDSERDIYIGKLQNIDSDMLRGFDYVAMGHIHKPQKISQQNTLRYSGSPIPLSFSEANNQKSVVLVKFVDAEVKVDTLDIPLFKKLYRLHGNFEEIQTKIEAIADLVNPPFVEILLKDSEILNYDINDFIYQSNQAGVDILMLKREKEIQERGLAIEDESITLRELDPLDIFDKRLEGEVHLNVDTAMKQNLQALYAQVLEECKNEDN